VRREQEFPSVRQRFVFVHTGSVRAVSNINYVFMPDGICTFVFTLHKSLKCRVFILRPARCKPYVIHIFKIIFRIFIFLYFYIFIFRTRVLYLYYRTNTFEYCSHIPVDRSNIIYRFRTRVLYSCLEF
jgi:hypothetical protein